jgi:hypothetical protein
MIVEKGPNSKGLTSSDSRDTCTIFMPGLFVSLCSAMFSSLRLFKSLPCPQVGSDSCLRPNCPFSHDLSVKAPKYDVPYDVPATVPTKRPAPAPSASPVASRPGSSTGPNAPYASSSKPATPSGPPTKFQRVGPTSRPVAVATATQTAVSEPLSRHARAYALACSVALLFCV